MEAQERKCEKCGREFTSVSTETNDDYKNYCSSCYKQMIQDRYEAEELEFYDMEDD